MTSPTVTLVVAVSENGVIGRDGGMPWRLSGDLKRFKADTIGKPVVMGRKTFQSIGKPLPGRENIVISRDATLQIDGVEVVQSLEDALAVARDIAFGTGADDIAIIGGGEIYQQAIAFANRIILTRVLGSVEGDTLFPEIQSNMWLEIESEDFPAGEKDTHATKRIVYVRRR